jgi:hypothetical protein
LEKGSVKRAAINRAINRIGILALLNQLHKRATARKQTAFCKVLDDYRWECFEWVLEAMDAAGYLQTVSVQYAANKNGGT